MVPDSELFSRLARRRRIVETWTRGGRAAPRPVYAGLIAARLVVNVAGIGELPFLFRAPVALAGGQ